MSCAKGYLQDDEQYGHGQVGERGGGSFHAQQTKPRLLQGVRSSLLGMTAPLSYDPQSARALQTQLQALLPTLEDEQVKVWLEPYLETLPTPHSSEFETLSSLLRALDPRLPTLLAAAVRSDKLEMLEREEIEARQARTLEGRGRGRRLLEAFLMRRNAQGKRVLNRAGITAALVAGVMLLTVGSNVFLNAREGQRTARGSVAKKTSSVTSTASGEKVKQNPSEGVGSARAASPSRSNPLPSDVPTRDPAQQTRLVARIRAQQAHTKPTLEPAPSVSKRVPSAVVVVPKVLPTIQAMPVTPRVIEVPQSEPLSVSEVVPEVPRATPYVFRAPISQSRGPQIRVTPRVEASVSRAPRPLRVIPAPSVRVAPVPSEATGETQTAMVPSPLPRFVPAPTTVRAQPVMRALPSRSSSTPSPIPPAIPSVDSPYVPSSPPPIPNPAQDQVSSEVRGPLELVGGDTPVKTAVSQASPHSLELAGGTPAPAAVQSQSLELASGVNPTSSAAVSRVQAQLVSSVTVSTQTSSVPIVAVSQDGRSWSGEARLEPDGRVVLRFSRLQSAQGVQVVNTLASSSDGVASFDGGYHLEDAGIAGQLVGQGVSQLQDYAQKQVAEASGNNLLVNALTSSLLSLAKPSRSSAQVGVASLPVGTVVLLEEPS